jgi:hypothetical protein
VSRRAPIFLITCITCTGKLVKTDITLVLATMNVVRAIGEDREASGYNVLVDGLHLNSVW